VRALPRSSAVPAAMPLPPCSRGRRRAMPPFFANGSHGQEVWCRQEERGKSVACVSVPPQSPEC